MTHNPDMWHWPSLWFLLISIIVLIALGVWYLITKQAGTAFWIIMVVDLIVLIIAAIILLVATFSTKQKVKAKVDLDDLQGMSQFPSGSGSSL